MTPEERSVIGRRSRRKGQAWERKLVKKFNLATPIAGNIIKRGLQSRFGTEVADVEHPMFAIEAKHQKKPNVKAALLQAETIAQAGQWPIAVCKWHGMSDEEAIVGIRLDDFLDLVAEWWERAQ